MEKFIVWGFSILVSAFVGYISGYMKKKGENFATKEDLDDLAGWRRAQLCDPQMPSGTGGKDAIYHALH